MRIGELADQLGLNTKTIRYYESIGLLPEPARTPSGYRDYDDRAGERLRFIRTAQRLGITLDEIREILAFRDRGDQPCGYVREVLRRQVDEIDERIAELRQLRRELVTLDDIADQLPDPGPGQCRLIEHVRQHDASNAASTAPGGERLIAWRPS
ncbi:MAG: heavy metal-responsive transcriptional regulator [Terrimonas ferruginea]|uniref:heavy metal-responsive transcriptional regulator n=1 Tax=Terrimonas ferruginea TaxID=249 RepID=UPI001AC52A87|nr:heavy metal-responsive transcriptional regulator [Terrimonas ferruginea]MBN8785385.1 heavy metal-responsive transcriptional regulator [Terrimonas ferruginea]